MDGRDIATGLEIPSEGYCDQPYVVVNDDGSWTCVMTTGRGHEGARGQHVVSYRSTDAGRTWGGAVALEPADGPEASYAVLLKTSAGRIYAFYNHNTDDVRHVKADAAAYPGGWCVRVDSLGHFVFRYSDDGGRSWSRDRYDVPQRNMQIDRENADGGSLRYFWNVGRPFVRGGTAYVPIHKVGGFGAGFFTRTEGAFLSSPDVLAEPDASAIRWETLPAGDVGLHAPAGGGPIAEEQSAVVLSDGAIYCTYRTTAGRPACAYSRDGGRTWGEPGWARYADGRAIKHPRAANFAWKCSNGKYLYWFHNNGTTSYNGGDQAGNRNPAWLCGGVEADAPAGRVIRWSQPEIALYADDPFTGISYPDLVESGGRLFVTETQKSVARVHELDRTFVEMLWAGLEGTLAAPADAAAAWTRGAAGADEFAMPRLPEFVAARGFATESTRAGLSVGIEFTLPSPAAGQALVDARTPSGRGLALVTTERGTVELVLNDGRTECRWDTDPGLVAPGRPHRLVAIADGGPRVILFVVDGALCDGGEARAYGWGRFSPNLRGAGGADRLRAGTPVSRVRVWGRALRVSEAVAATRR